MTSSTTGWGAAALRALAHRADAWGVALVVSILPLYLHDQVRGATLHLAAAIGLAYLLGYTVNDYFDAPADREDASGGHQNFFVHHPISPRTAALLLTVAAGVVFSGYARFGLPGVLAFLLSVSVILAYSAPPIRLKGRPGLDLATHALFVQTFPYVLGVVLTGTRWTATDVVLVVIMLLASMSGQLAQQLRDLPIDRATAVRTFTVAVGESRARRLLQGVTAVLALLVVGSFVGGVIPLVFAPLALPFGPALVTRLGGRGSRHVLVVRCCAGAALLYSFGLAAVGFRGHVTRPPYAERQ